MPGKKQRTVRRKVRKPPKPGSSSEVPAHPSNGESAARSSIEESRVSAVSTGPSPASSMPAADTASRKKLTNSPLTSLCDDSWYSHDEQDQNKWTVILEVAGLQEALKKYTVCSTCYGPVSFRCNSFPHQGLGTPSIFCENCDCCGTIPFSAAEAQGRSLAINRRSVFANKCIGGTRASLETFCAIMDLPPPLTQVLILTMLIL